MNLSFPRARPQTRPAEPPPQSLYEERLKALASDLIQAFARIARRRF
jgi:hypothetical protein